MRNKRLQLTLLAAALLIAYTRVHAQAQAQSGAGEALQQVAVMGSRAAARSALDTVQPKFYSSVSTNLNNAGVLTETLTRARRQRRHPGFRHRAAQG